MLRNTLNSFLLLTILIFFVDGVYPLALWITGQTFFSFQANGSILNNKNGNPIGSLLIAQSFTSAEYFKSRPSAAMYRADASASSTLAPSNVALRDRVAKQIRPLVNDTNSHLIPGDYVTTSASGLDPHITLQNAHYQLNHVAKAWSIKLHRNPSEIQQEIASLLEEHASAPWHGLLGEKMVNVLEINRLLENRYGGRQ